MKVAKYYPAPALPQPSAPISTIISIENRSLLILYSSAPHAHFVMTQLQRC